MTSRRASSLAAIESIARAIAGEQPPVVFVGGTVTALYPLEAGVDVRPTADVDCVVDVGSTAAYYAFVARLRARGFRECTDEDAPLCRLVYKEIRVDIVATTETAVGPTNRWYRDAVDAATSHALSPDVKVLAITPIFFVATKLEAFRGRGAGDYMASHDLEDVLTVLAGIPSLRDEIVRAASRVAAEIRHELVAMRANDAFVDALPGHFDGDEIGQRRADDILDWLATLRSV